MARPGQASAPGRSERDGVQVTIMVRRRRPVRRALLRPDVRVGSGASEPPPGPVFWLRQRRHLIGDREETSPARPPLAPLRGAPFSSIPRLPAGPVPAARRLPCPPAGQCQERCCRDRAATGLGEWQPHRVGRPSPPKARHVIISRCARPRAHVGHWQNAGKTVHGL